MAARKKNRRIGASAFESITATTESTDQVEVEAEQATPAVEEAPAAGTQSPAKEEEPAPAAKPKARGKAIGVTVKAPASDAEDLKRQWWTLPVSMIDEMVSVYGDWVSRDPERFLHLRTLGEQPLGATMLAFAVDQLEQDMGRDKPKRAGVSDKLAEFLPTNARIPGSDRTKKDVPRVKTKRTAWEISQDLVERMQMAFFNWVVADRANRGPYMSMKAQPIACGLIAWAIAELEKGIAEGSTAEDDKGFASVLIDYVPKNARITL